MSEVATREPQLRFPEFSDSLIKGALGDYALIKRGAGSQYIEYSKDSKDSIRLIRIGDFLGGDAVFVRLTNAIQRFLLDEGDILIAGTGATAGITFLVPTKFVGMAYSYNAPKIKVHKDNVSFFYQYLISPKIKIQQIRLFTGNAQPFLDTNAIKGFSIFKPPLQEQQKIAAFLTAVDNKIEQLSKKQALLGEYKKGLMQQIFSQAIRFKSDDGGTFPDWEEKNGNEIFDNISNKNHDSDLPILAITQEHGAIPRDLINYKMIVSDKSVSSYKVVETGDFIISLRSFQGGIEYSNYKGICSPAYIILRPAIEIEKKFYKYYLKTYRYIQDLNRKLEGIRDGKMVSYKYFSEIKLPYPSISEQAKIANFLSSIDNKIEQVGKQLRESKQFKKALLQQMFV